ncbi:MAG TPA: NUDIX domain-containing protein [Acidimicrobiia bacterium]|nr:NUDIX domain-containing protein [Acidimicrobiia bacterium]
MPRELVDATVRLLAAHEPVDAREASSVARVRDELRRLDTPFDEHADLVHVTGSAVVIGPRGVLLLVHRRMGFWMQPGGHVEAGESPWDAAVRETREETGVLVDHPPTGPCLVHVDVHQAARGHTHLDLRFLVLAPTDDEPCPPPGESQQVQWFAWADAFDVGDASLHGALRAAQPLVRQYVDG